jgi:selenocysteine lyase/cysteine desulfurase
VETARTLFAGLAGVDDAEVSAMGSVAEGVATVAATLPPGSIVVGDAEYRSVLFPFLALDPDRHTVIRVPSDAGTASTEELAAAIRDDTVLVASSDTLTSTGRRVDAARLRTAADRVGARLLLDLTQSMGVLRHDLTATRPDYVVVHGYKWLLCPRGAAWLIARGDRVHELAPLLPSWKSTDPPFGYFGGSLDGPPTAARLDTSPAWFSWVGAVAALRLMARLDPADVENHCVNLARRWWEGARDLGYRPVLERQDSHIAVVDLGAGVDRVRERLASARVKATILGSRLRIGVHYFVDEHDIDRALDALVPAREEAAR